MSKVVLSQIGHLGELLTALNGYRVSRGCVALASKTLDGYVNNILEQKHGVFAEYHGAHPVGFVHMKPSFSSVSMIKICTAAPFVMPKAIMPEDARHLIQDTEAIALAMGGERVLIQTADNQVQQLLSQDPDYHIDMYVNYSKRLPSPVKEAYAEHYSRDYDICRAAKVTREIVELFNKYRIFYNKEDDLEGCEQYITARLGGNESIVFTAEHGGNLVGIIQYYPTYSDEDAGKAMTLNDLYVDQSARGKGVATALMMHTEKFLAELGVIRISLKTAPDNPARALYERLGYEEQTLDSCFYKELDSSENTGGGVGLDLVGLEALTISCDDYE